MCRKKDGKGDGPKKPKYRRVFITLGIGVGVWVTTCYVHPIVKGFFIKNEPTIISWLQENAQYIRVPLTPFL